MQRLSVSVQTLMLVPKLSIQRRFSGDFVNFNLKIPIYP